MIKRELNVFTIDFPYGNGEPFLKNELDILSNEFNQINIFPLYFKNQTIKYQLPVNVKIHHFDIFDSYSRLNVLIKNVLLISRIFFIEILKSTNRKYYLFNFGSHLNNLLHRINAAEKLGQKFDSRSEKYLVYTYWFTQWTLIFSLINAKKKNINLFTRIHGMDVYENQHQSKIFFFSFRIFQSKHINKVISISENGRKHLLNKSPYFKNKIVISRLGVLNHGFNPINNSNEFLLVSCSSFQKYKRVELIVQILKKIDFKLTWIHFGESEEKHLIENEIQNLPSNITIKLKGYIGNNELMNFYANNSVDLFINVSETEGIPVSIMEAMSFGIPCVATNVGGVSEIVNDTNGYLIEKDFDIDFVAKLIKKHKDLSEKEILNFRDEAYQTWETKYNVLKNTNDLIKILKNEN